MSRVPDAASRLRLDTRIREREILRLARASAKASLSRPAGGPNDLVHPPFVLDAAPISSRRPPFRFGVSGVRCYQAGRGRRPVPVGRPNCPSHGSPCQVLVATACARRSRGFLGSVSARHQSPRGRVSRPPPRTHRETTPERHRGARTACHRQSEAYLVFLTQSRLRLTSAPMPKSATKTWPSTRTGALNDDGRAGQESRRPTADDDDDQITSLESEPFDSNARRGRVTARRFVGTRSHPSPWDESSSDQPH